MKASDREVQVRQNLHKLALMKALDREEQVRRNVYKLALVKASDMDSDGGTGERRFV